MRQRNTFQAKEQDKTQGEKGGKYLIKSLK